MEKLIKIESTKRLPTIDNEYFVIWNNGNKQLLRWDAENEYWDCNHPEDNFVEYWYEEVIDIEDDIIYSVSLTKNYVVDKQMLVDNFTKDEITNYLYLCIEKMGRDLLKIEIDEQILTSESEDFICGISKHNMTKL